MLDTKEGVVNRRRLTIYTIPGILCLLLVIVLIPAVLVHLTRGYRDFQQKRQEALQANLGGARAVAIAFQTYLRDNARMQEVLGEAIRRTPGRSQYDLDELYTHLVRTNSTWQDWHWVSPEGHILSSSQPAIIGRSIVDEPYFQSVANGKSDWAISGLYRDPVTDEPIFTVATNIRDDRNRLLGVSLVSVDPLQLDMLFTRRRPPGTVYMLIDRNGTLAYRQPHRTLTWQQRKLLTRWPFLAVALRGEEVTGSAQGMDSVQRIFAMSPVESTGWIAAVSSPEQATMGPVRRDFIRDIVFFLLLSGTAFTLALIVTRHLTGPLNRLCQFTRHVANGELDRRVSVTGPVELTELAAALNRMTVDLQERTTQLEWERARAGELATQESRYAETLRVLIQTVPAGIIQCDREGNFVLLNPMAVEMLGEEAKGGNAFGPMEGFEFFTADGAPFPLRDMPLSRALTEGAVIRDLELCVRCPDGREVILLSSSGPLCDTAGNISGAVAVVQDITPLHQLQEERELFIHTISHDLRTPLTIIQGHTQMLADLLTETTVDGGMTSVDAIMRAASRINVMIRDLVDSARLAGHTMELHAETVEIRAYLENLLQRAAAGMEVSRIRLELPDALPPVRADYDRLERIIMNLLSNALKYSPPEEPVTISAHQEEDSVVISITDRGIGISPEDLTNLFERFYRAHGAREIEGIGLGLYITRLLVEAHGGRIWAESTPGEGSTFSFILPMA